jgi:hypothetical protein
MVSEYADVAVHSQTCSLVVIECLIVLFVLAFAFAGGVVD